jgi:hypothetical protein
LKPTITRFVNHRLALEVVKGLRGARISQTETREKTPKKNPRRITISVLMKGDLDYSILNSAGIAPRG